MKVYFISNGIWEYDGRLRELVNVSMRIGDTTYLTRGQKHPSYYPSNHIIISTNSYLKFIFKTVQTYFKFGKIDVAVVDNRKAVIPALIIMMLNRPQNIIYDARELYLLNEVRHFSGKMGCIIEKQMITRADVIICANTYRASLMKEHYKLKKEPLVYENVRKLKYSKEFEKKIFEKKYDGVLKKDKFRIISTSGFSVSRTNDKLVEAMKKLGEDFELLLVGGGSKEDKKFLEEIISNLKLENVKLIEKVEPNELKYLISISNMGVVNYHQNDLNNEYCASGKIYEFLFEGIPVVTTENPPLKEICNKYRIGVSDNSYTQGIKEIKNNYSKYKENVVKFSQEYDVSENNENLVSNILLSLK